jgi:LmbE family N-acetylglucosaminyl deacetylase
MDRSYVSFLGHTITIMAYLGVAAYTYFYRRELSRTTRNSSYVFFFILSVSLLFAAVNLFRIVFEIFGGLETTYTYDLDMVGHYSSVIAQTILILVLFANKIVIEPVTHPGCVLAIGAHPDDIEIAAGAALAKFRDAGYHIIGLVLTQGEKGGHEDVRPGEARRGADFLGLDEIETLDLCDTRLNEQINDVITAIETKVRKIGPDIIFTHSNHDLHQDHQVVYEATLRAARSTRTTILCYESPSVTQDFHPTYFIDVDKYVDVKIAAIREHWDQRNKPYMKPELVRGKLAFRGAQAKVDYAEGFEVARMVSRI